ncbi:MAG: HEAT repeat domain-containing protein [Bacteroidia bacterium]|nr:HEAT repeat domain-containing protein [Bacteroidia bacterium]
MKRLLLLSLFTFAYSLLPALTWSEPWQEDVINNSEYFVLGKVINSERGSVKIKVIKNLGGKEIESEFTLQGFHMLSVCTKDNEEDAPTFYFHMIDTVYLFIKKSDIGYCIPTPTSGYAIVSGGKALSTFRHSYHQAHLPMATYEKVMTAIWNSYKGLPVDTKFVTEYTNKYLKQKPAGFRDHEINLFFNQHAALELVNHLKLSDKFLLISPFVNCANNHLMISAVRCLGNMNTTESKKLLVDYIKDDTKDNFTRVMAVWSLKKLNPAELKAQLKTIYDTANETPTGFGGSKEDPRICTYIPNLKEALNTLLGQL